HDVVARRRCHQELPPRSELVHHEAGDILRPRRCDERARPLLARNRGAATGAGVATASPDEPSNREWHKARTAVSWRYWHLAAQARNRRRPPCTHAAQ